MAVLTVFAVVDVMMMMMMMMRRRRRREVWEACPRWRGNWPVWQAGVLVVG